MTKSELVHNIRLKLANKLEDMMAGDYDVILNVHRTIQARRLRDGRKIPSAPMNKKAFNDVFSLYVKLNNIPLTSRTTFKEYLYNEIFFELK